MAQQASKFARKEAKKAAALAVAAEPAAAARTLEIFGSIGPNWYKMGPVEPNRQAGPKWSKTTQI